MFNSREVFVSCCSVSFSVKAKRQRVFRLGEPDVRPLTLFLEETGQGPKKAESFRLGEPDLLHLLLFRLLQC